jgi:hypothetical protein
VAAVAAVTGQKYVKKKLRERVYLPQTQYVSLAFLGQAL